MLFRSGTVAAWGVSSEVVLDYRRLLHEEESAYFSTIVKDMAARAQVVKKSSSPKELTDDLKTLTEIDSVAGQNTVFARSDRLSFGDGEVRIVQVETLDREGNPSSVYYPGDLLRIKVVCEAQDSVEKLNVAVRLRNKEGVKIYSWGTLNQDMTTLADRSGFPIFWKKEIKAGEKFQVLLECDCNLGVNLYEVQAAVSFEETPDYMSQRMLHWVDEAAFFQVSMKRDEYFFGGVVDLKMIAKW